MENKEKIGIFFCGGCNCYFSREDFYQEIMDNLGEKYSFSLCKPDDSGDFDLVLVINGCQSECLLNTEYKCDVLLINNKNYENGINLIIEKIEGMKTTKGH